MIPGKAEKPLALLWAGLAVSLGIKAWPGYADSLNAIWNAWLSSPDLSWHSFGLSLAGHLASTTLPLLLLVAMYGAGRGVSQLFRTRDPFIRLALGMGVISIFVQGLGYPGLYFRAILGITALIYIVLGILSLSIDRPWREFAGEDWKNAVPKLAVLGGILACGYMLGRLPDTDQDARIYHMAAPENFIFLHRITAEPANFSWHMPLGAEMSFLIPYAFGGITWAKQVNVAALVILLGLVWRLSGSLGRRSLWAPVWMGTAGLVMSQCWEGKNDLVAAMYLTGAALYAVRGRLVASSFLMGLAMGVKLTAGLLVAGLVAGLFFTGAVRNRRSPLAAVIIPVLGWLAGAWLFIGNPFHPFLSGLFPEISWSPYYLDCLNRFGKVLSPPEALSKWDWVLGIWRGIGSYDTGSVGLFWILPAALLGLRGGKARILAIAVMAAYLLWLPTIRISRYLFPLIPLIAAAYSDGGAMSGLFSGWNRAGLRRLLGACSAAAVLGLTLQYMGPSGFLYLLGQKSRDELLRGRYTTWDEARAWVNSGTSPGSRILLTGDTCRLWFKERVISSSFVGEPVLWKLTGESADAVRLAIKIRQRGITHILDNFISGEYRAYLWFPGPKWKPRQLAVYREFSVRHLKILDITGHPDGRNGGFYLYGVEPGGRRGRNGNAIHHLPSTEGVFSRAYSLLGEGKFAESLSEARRMDGIMGHTFHGASVMGRIYAVQKSYPEAVRILEPGISAGFMGYSNWADYGGSVLFSSPPAKAVKVLGQVYRVMRDDWFLSARADALVAMGNGWLAGREGRLESKAGEHERPIIPEGAKIPVKRLKKALELYEQAVWMDPREPYFYIGCMRVLILLDRYGEARVYGARAIEASGGKPEITALVDSFVSREIYGLGADTK